MREAAAWTYRLDRAGDRHPASRFSRASITSGKSLTDPCTIGNTTNERIVHQNADTSDQLLGQSHCTAKLVNLPQPTIEPRSKMFIFPRCKCGRKVEPPGFCEAYASPLLCGCLRSHSEFQADNDIPNDTASAKSSHAFSGRNLGAESPLFLAADRDRPHCFHGGF